jgi:glutamine synthetase
MGKMKIDFVYDDAFKNADKVATFKYITKTIATQMSLRATIMPTTIYGAAGTGVHANVPLFRGSESAFNNLDTTHGYKRPGHELHRRAPGACSCHYGHI